MHIMKNRRFDWVAADSYEAMSAMAAETCIAQLHKKPDSVLGLATGETPRGLYQALAEQYRIGRVSFAEVKTFNLDEYVGIGKENPASYHAYMQHHFFRHIDIQPEHCHLPNGMAQDLEGECARYEEQIASSGGIDLQVLGIGVNGHIGFNEPGTSFSSRTHIVTLAESTRQQNARHFGSPEDMPRQAITMGIQTIMQSRKIILLAFGEHKMAALERLESDRITKDFPAAILRKHPHVTVFYGK